MRAPQLWPAAILHEAFVAKDVPHKLLTYASITVLHFGIDKYRKPQPQRRVGLQVLELLLRSEDVAPRLSLTP